MKAKPLFFSLLILCAAVSSLLFSGCATTQPDTATEEDSKSTVIRLTAYSQLQAPSGSIFMLPAQDNRDIEALRRIQLTEQALLKAGFTKATSSKSADYLIVVLANDVMDISNELARGSVILRALDGQAFRRYQQEGKLQRSVPAVWEVTSSYLSKLQLPLQKMFPILLEEAVPLIGQNRATFDIRLEPEKIEALLGLSEK